ncbi:KRAB-A domain-containing protein 2 [Trichinella sp. T9]|nr:KRAB-A domain-containing protein 2 [Trichinella sp. T9]
MDRKAVFEEKFRTLIKEKGQNAKIFPTSQRDQMITDILRIQSDGQKSVLWGNTMHRQCCLSKHWPWWRKRTFQKAQNKWANVTREACHMFATLCEECHKKRARKLPKSLVVKPPVSTNVMSRGQVDVINFQALLDVKTGRSGIKAARNLHNLFWLFCNPTTVKCHNAPSSAIITELKTCWPELKLVTGRSRHPQSQGAIERLNGVVQKKLAIRMQEKMQKYGQ